MSEPKTLLALAGADLTPSPLSRSVLVLIDCQMEYVDGLLPLPDVAPALAQAKALLDAARAAGTPVIHIVHKGRPGGPFDLDGHGGAIAAAVTPRAGETVIEKTLPNAFAGTGLDDAIKATKRDELILAGFQTHMCVSATARSALDHGYRATIVAGAAATRDLPDGNGGIVDAATLHRVCLAALADRFAIIAPSADSIPR